MKQVLTGLGVLLLSALAFGQDATATSAATTTAEISAVKPAAKKVGVTFFQGLYNGVEATNNNDFDGAYGDSFIDVSYKLDDVQKVSIRQNFWMNQSDATRTDEYELYDFMARYAHAKALQVAGSDVAAETRIYLPVSDWSREIGKLEFRQSLALDRALTSKLTASYGAQGRLYHYTEDESGQRGARSFVDAKLAYEVNSAILPYVQIQHEGAWRHNGKALSPSGSRSEKDDTYNAANIYLGSAFSITKNLSVEAYLGQYRDLTTTTAFQLFDPKETEYSLEMAVSL